MTQNCGDCRLGLVGGAVCTKCEGTTFITEQKEVKETVVQKVKKVLKK